MLQQLKQAVKRFPRLERYSHYLGRMINLLKRLVKQGAYMGWSYLVLDEEKVLYLVNQKVACTSIKASMVNLDSNEYYVDVIRAIRRTGHTATSLNARDYRDYFVFTFVRDPFTRLISCYENKYHPKSRPGQSAHHLKYDYYLMGYLRKDRGFRSFARRVSWIPDRIADNHFASQSFIIDRMGKNPTPNFIGHFERLEEEYEPIRKKYGFMPLPHHNPTEKAAFWMDYYDLSTARRVYRRYRKDIERFGYQSTYEALIEYLKSKEARQPKP
jgi:chondroitin 4-sulfotransferase 11